MLVHAHTRMVVCIHGYLLSVGRKIIDQYLDFSHVVTGLVGQTRKRNVSTCGYALRM